MKNSFHCMVRKALFVCEVFKFLSWLLGNVEKRLDKKAKVNFKIYDVIDGTANHYDNIQSNISRTNGNQAMKIGQLIKCNMTNNFLE